MNSEEQYIEMEAARIDSSEQYFSARPQIDWADRRRVFEAGFDRGWKAALKSQAKSGPAEGEEIMVNTPYDVFTLSLKPSGLTSGPRFVVHVPGPEQTAAVDGAIDKARFERAPCYLCGYNGPGYYQPDTHPCAAKYHTAQHQKPTT